MNLVSELAPLQLGSGAWVLPFWREPGKTCPQIKSEVKDPAELAKGSAGVLLSGNQGLTWRVRGNLTSPGTWLIENTVVELESRALLQHFRTRKGVAYASTSADGGETWSTPARTSIPNPNSKMHTLRAEPGLLIAAYNHHPRLRSPLVLAASRDDGAAWKTFAVVGRCKLDPSLKAACFQPLYLRVHTVLST